MSDGLSRREFVQTSATLTAALAVPSWAYAAGSDTIRVGVIGCGGRGSGATQDCLRASSSVEVIALGDLMPDRLDGVRARIAQALATTPDVAARFKVADDMMFTGFDAYQKVLATDVHYVILATPPGFRPLHLRAAVDAGKHIFSEKPVATDIAGIKSVLETYALANQKNLRINVGTQRRHHVGYQEIIKRIQDGAIGDVINGQVYWNQAGLWSREKDPAWSDMEWQIRNWLYFTWLSGDHIVEQHVHNIDVANWVMGGPPVRAISVGGRASRVQPVYGHIFDHFGTDFEYANGVHILSMARQIEGARGRNGEWFQGSKGGSSTSENAQRLTITGPNAYDWTRPETGFVRPMEQEHADLIKAIQDNKPMNELKRIAESTLTAIMAREAAYTGDIVNRDELLLVEQNLAPCALHEVAFGPVETPPIPMAGRTKVLRSFVEGW
jgi:predicted dehydrogenase